ncbi:alpha-amylase [Zhouia spongiae]|uniref:Alpha-amylase n=1 Tax=Zhouia spongiae TaxID=2202721 RepID=A0ABY3YQH4_9FLAO|nr:alpha-amylase [Zhouia spongiae]UNZ00126.1 alpha-amylase [Zhouia spongiae]
MRTILSITNIQRTIAIILGTGLLWSCSNDDFSPRKIIEQREESDLPTGTAQTRQDLLTPGEGVMMQAFYWDVTEGGIWWNNISSKLDDWAANGIDAIWIPPVSKGQSGGFSMGYDPYDYFDFGDFEQHGTIETRFGNRSELENMISKAHENNIAVIADMVINHNSGGDIEYNQFRQLETYTLFRPASQKFNRSQYDFHPNANHLNDEGKFGGFPDLDLKSEYVRDWMWKSEESVAGYYMNVLKIDGWRFDFVKGYSPEIVKDWVAAIGGFAVGENFDGNLSGVVQPWVEASGANAFDFPNFFNMKDAFSQGNLTLLNNPSLFASLPDKAVTFVGNHDTEARGEGNEFPDAYESHAYAFIMSAPGYPTVFYSHYEDSGDEQKQKIQQLIQIRSELAAGDWSVEYSDNDEFIAKRSGDGNKPGLMLYINTSDSEASKEVLTPWMSANIKDYTENIFLFTNTDASGTAVIKAPANGYAIWSYTTEEQNPFPEVLYLPGSYQGWNPATATIIPSVELPNLLGTYIGHVTLTGTSNEFKITDAPDWDNGIYGDTGDGTTSGMISSPGENISLPGPLDYQINIDLINNTWSAFTWAIIGSSTPNGWNDPDTDMTYDYDRGVWTITANLTDGELKFRANNEWTVNLGDNEPDGTLEQDGTNIQVNEGSYVIDLNPIAGTYALNNWGVIGAATPGGWDTDTNMVYDTNSQTWSVTLDLVPGEFKFRFADDWAVNLGDNEQDGTLEQDGANLNVATAGNYTIILDLSDNTYSVTLN